MNMKQTIITFLLLLAFTIGALKIYSIRTEKIENGEMILVDQHEK